MTRVHAESLIPVERAVSRIYPVRGTKVMFDFDLAEMYGVGTKAINQAVSRNLERFPPDFMFRFKADEAKAFNRSQIVTGSQKHRDPRFPPRVFTQEGVAMLSSVLRSRRAVEVNISIMRAFVRLRELLATNEDLARKVAQHDEENRDAVRICSAFARAGAREEKSDRVYCRQKVSAYLPTLSHRTRQGWGNPFVA
jgi:ORF6N domain